MHASPYKVVQAILILGVLDAAPAQAQDTTAVPLTVGNPLMNPGHLRAFGGEWIVREIAPDGAQRVVEQAWDSLDVVAKDGTLTFRQRQGSRARNTSLSIIHDGVTFAPLIVDARDHSTGDSSITRFFGRRATVVCSGGLCPADLRPRPGGDTSRVIELAEPVFDYWGGSYGLLLALLPLREGLIATIPVYHPLRGVVRLRAQVEGREVIVSQGREFQAWIVRLPQTGFTYHIAAEAPFWLRLSYTRPDGSKQLMERP